MDKPETKANEECTSSNVPDEINMNEIPSQSMAYIKSIFVFSL
jgi:hypothetical protein